VLWQLRRPLSDVPAVPLPEGVRLRPFVVGQDEDAWLAVNAAAFADHAEQGRWTRSDLESREREPWFDPPGFLLAFRDDTLVGFHWTKVHPTGIGEVYVLGVAPQAQGLRLGSALLTAGLEYLAGRGVTEVMLYVDESNAAAIRMYERYGFAPYDVDAQYVRP
jgi:mycothiol synthase